MADVTQNELVGDIARDVVTQLAPQELPIFRAVRDAYFANPESALKNLKSEDGVLGFGLDPTAFLFTPVVLHVLSEIVQFLIPIAKKAVQDRVGSEVAELSKRLFNKLKIAVFAPIPNARESVAMQVNPELFRRVRSV